MQELLFIANYFLQEMLIKVKLGAFNYSDIIPLKSLSIFGQSQLFLAGNIYESI